MEPALPDSPAAAADTAAPLGARIGAEETTPLLAQYLDIKRRHPDHLLFYRMGDFYELFFDDAVKAAAALDIVLTKRGRHGGAEVAMAGVPVKAHEVYLERLIRKGFKVAVCEQMEDPALARRRGGVVARDVVRVITAGTLTEDTLLDARRHNYLAALAEAAGGFGLAWLDMSTGDFVTEPLAPDEIGTALARLDPGELLLADRLVERPDLRGPLADWRPILTPLPASRFDSENGRRRLEALYRVQALDGFASFGRAEIAAAGALVDYVELTQSGRLPHLAPPRRMAAGGSLAIDAATRRNLELTRTLAGERAGSLLAGMDRSVTGGGARLLSQWLAAPLADAAPINERLDMVDFFVRDERLRTDLRRLLAGMPDLERALSRLSLARGGPRDLAAVRDGLAVAAAIHGRVGQAGLATPPAGVTRAVATLDRHGALIDRLGGTLAPDLPLMARDGGFIRPGCSGELDAQKTLRDESRRLIADMQARYAGETQLASLKIKHNNVLGFFVEVGQAHGERLARDSRFIHRQSMANAMRYTTVELGELESRISEAGERALALELELFQLLANEVAAAADGVAEAARAVALLDVVAGLGELAEVGRHVRPVVDGSLAFSVTQGRHPVVEAALEERQVPFVANDCDLGPDRRLWLVTGPNMAGKSTFLRQNALIAIMAQMGAFVPAASAHIGVVDRLFSRVGAADDLARGRSTFMVEMVETAAILNQAGPRSLVILDEIGRGTATFDGLSIAWATVEHLCEVNRCRGLFATHFHELTALAARLAVLQPYTMRVKEWRGDVVFLHEVAPGAADRSYGVHVARLAGLPAAVIARAEAVLQALEAGDQAGAVQRLAQDLPLFAALRAPLTRLALLDSLSPVGERVGVRGVSGPVETALEAAVAAIEPDSLSPREALELIYRLKALARGEA